MKLKILMTVFDCGLMEFPTQETDILGVTNMMVTGYSQKSIGFLSIENGWIRCLIARPVSYLRELVIIARQE